jgi:uncharacterized protein
MPTLADLEAVVATVDNAIVAFSGGVDSSVVAAVAHRVLGERALAVTAVSSALASGELADASAVARFIGIEHETIETNEMDRVGYRQNGRDRCYHCKTELYETLGRISTDRGFTTLFSGANADDLGDWRPGLRAATEHRVRHPLLEAGLGKTDIRAVARRLGLPSADKPAMPCLASRLPYGTHVEASVLAQVDRAEQALRALGFRELRVRHFGTVGRVELGGADLARAQSSTTRAQIRQAIREAGYDEVEIDPQPFRSGSLNRFPRPLRILDP